MKFCYSCHVHIDGEQGMSKLLDHFIDYPTGTLAYGFTRASTSQTSGSNEKLQRDHENC